MSCANAAKFINGTMQFCTGTPDLNGVVQADIVKRVDDLLRLDNLPTPVQRVIRVLENQGYRTVIAGGAVRDAVMGAWPPKDYDLEIEYGPGPERLHEALSQVVDDVGTRGKFVVYGMVIDGIDIEVAMRRKDGAKTGFGYTGFDPEYAPGISDEDAASRRDYSVNAMMFDPTRRAFFDFFDGLGAIESGEMRHNTGAYSDDPVRVLRGISRVSQYKMVFAPGTAVEAEKALYDYAAHELYARAQRSGSSENKVLAAFGESRQPGESFEDAIRRIVQNPEILNSCIANPEVPDRIWKEWDRICKKDGRPSLSIQALLDTGWIRTVPELMALDGIPQDAIWHPEGDALTHVAKTLDAAQAIANRDGLSEDESRILFFSMLFHDLGKAAFRSDGTPITQTDQNGRVRSPGHDEASVPLAARMAKRIGVPDALMPAISQLVQCHMYDATHELSRKAVADLAESLHPATIRQWARVVEADHSGRPAPHDPTDANGRPLLLGDKSPGAAWLRMAEEMGCADSKIPYVVNGRTYIKLGVKGGKKGAKLGELLAQARQAQRNQEFTTEDGAIEWIKRRQKKDVLFLTGQDFLEKGFTGQQIGRLQDELFTMQLNGIGNRKEALEWLNNKVEQLSPS